jgi:hypothetical protein
MLCSKKIDGEEEERERFGGGEDIGRGTRTALLLYRRDSPVLYPCDNS